MHLERTLPLPIVARASAIEGFISKIYLYTLCKSLEDGRSGSQLRHRGLGVGHARRGCEKIQGKWVHKLSTPSMPSKEGVESRSTGGSSSSSATLKASSSSFCGSGSCACGE